jgi:hypothetical protein
LPPWCISKVRSSTRSTVAPSTASTASTTRLPCSPSTHDTVTSRSFVPFSTRTRSIAPRIAPVLPIALATAPNRPGRWRSRTRMVMLYDADGCTIAAFGADGGGFTVFEDMASPSRQGGRRGRARARRASSLWRYAGCSAPKMLPSVSLK